jgi:DNA (cytosine-5)-methyltransferase 1
MGYHRAGFDVVGVDIRPQPNYPFEFEQADALTFLLECGPFRGWFDAIHASPPCQAHSSMRHMWNAGDHPDLVAATRELLRATGLPYVIENVVGAPLIDPVMICGSSLGLKVRRHRLFETNWPLMAPPCAHGGQGVPVGVYGTGGGGQMTRGVKARGVAEARTVMDIDWMTLGELAQAIPPAYTELIGHQLLAHVQAVAA